MQVLRRRQVLPEEQHDPVPDRLRRRTDEGGLCAAGPLTTPTTPPFAVGERAARGPEGDMQSDTKALVSSPAHVPITLYI